MPATGLPEARPSLRVDNLRVAARQRDGSRLPILAVETLVAEPGARVAVTGPSGAGKSSLLAALAGILVPEAGRVSWGGEDVAALSERARDAWRRRSVGLVFQDFHLVPELDARANILLPATFARPRAGLGLEATAAALMDLVGLADPHRRAGLLSRGEQQRTAIARALLHEPAIILADEPTASLDEANGRVVIDLLVGTAERSGATLIAATHDPALIARLGTRWRLAGGCLEPGSEPP